MLKLITNAVICNYFIADCTQNFVYILKYFEMLFLSANFSARFFWQKFEKIFALSSKQIFRLKNKIFLIIFNTPNKNYLNESLLKCFKDILTRYGNYKKSNIFSAMELYTHVNFFFRSINKMCAHSLQLIKNANDASILYNNWNNGFWILNFKGKIII